MKMRWSLRTQVIVVLFAGLLLLVWQRREPWQYSHQSTFPELMKRAPYSIYSPDKTRYISKVGGTYRILDLTLSRPGEQKIPNLILCSVDYRSKDSQAFFLTNDAFAACLVNDTYPVNEEQFVVFTRRHPEWWWGHFYRPEVWLLPLWLGLIVWTIRKDRAVAK